MNLKSQLAIQTMYNSQAFSKANEKPNQPQLKPEISNGKDAIIAALSEAGVKYDKRLGVKKLKKILKDQEKANAETKAST